MRKNGRFIFSLLILISSLTLSLLLQSCQPMASTSLPECGESKTDLVTPLAGLGDEIARGIQLELCIPGGEGKYTVLTEDLDEKQKTRVKEVESPFPVAALVSYFEVQDSKGKTITEFDPPLELRVTYTTQALEEIMKRGFDEPRIAYLVRKGDQWGTAWVEFTKENAAVEFIRPGTEGQPKDTGLIIIKIQKLADPVIGGC